MNAIKIWDSGSWGQSLSAARVFTTIRFMELSGAAHISELRWVSAESEFSTQLEAEPQVAYNQREEWRRKRECARIERTAAHFNYEFTIDTPENVHPIRQTKGDPLFYVVAMPPCHSKGQLLHALLASENAATIVISPATFLNAGEIEKLIEAEKSSPNKRVVVFTPYRYSAAMTSVRNRIEESEKLNIEGLEASIVSGPYPRFGKRGFRALISEFSSPVLDCIIDLCGPVKGGSLLYKTTSTNHRPMLVVSSIHENEKEVISTIYITASGFFQSVNFDMRVYFDRENIHLVNAFRETKRYQQKHVISTESGHDMRPEERSGYTPLLENVLQNKKQLPSLTSYLPTQQLIDTILSSLAVMQKTGQKHITF